MPDDRLKLNLGCGEDIRRGFINIDLDPPLYPDYDDTCVWPGDMAQMNNGPHGLTVTDGSCDLVLINHALHQLSYDDADLALAEAWRVLAPGGQLVIVEADVLGVLGDWGERREAVARIVPETVEPTIEGRLLRWANWFGERRSLWSPAMLTQRVMTPPLQMLPHFGGRAEREEWVGNRGPESFVFIATK